MRRALANVTLAVLLIAPLSSVIASPAAAQIDGQIELIAQTRWIGPEPAVFDLRIRSTAEDQRLEIRIHAPVTTPAALQQAFANPPTKNVLSQFSITNLNEFTIGAGSIVSITVPDDEIGDVIRRAHGALPVVIDLTEDGEIVDTLITALLVADPTVRRQSIDLAFIADLQFPLAHLDDESISIDPNKIASTIEDFLAEVPHSTTVTFTPETLDAMAHPQIGDEETINRIMAAFESHAIFAAPWVDLDEEAWRAANENSLVLDYYALGQRQLESHLGRQATTIARLDPNTDARTLSLLRTAGVTGAVTSNERLSLNDVTQAASQPLHVLDDNGVAMPVVAPAEWLHQRLESDDLVLSTTQLMAEFALESTVIDEPRVYVLDLDVVNRAGLDALLGEMALDATYGFTTISELLSRSPARAANGTIIQGALLAEPSVAIIGASDLRLTEAVVDSYATMVAPAHAPVTPLRDLLLAAASSELDAEGRARYTSRVFDTIIAGITGFEVLDSSRITLASRSANVPISIRNAQPLPITVHFRVSSDKLQFPDGEQRQLVLEPGITELIIPVETAASGDARITVTLTSPDGRLDLTNGTVDIRSTAVSGLGLVITMIAFVILAMWWARTILRVRHQRSAATVAESEDMSKSEEKA
ncbi:MAG: DUF6049 family protein [Acidimicrobiales bacterium]|nr:DUF6049 family protein [Acidimicrobiales bacterium]MDG2219192.1 DUF6049 family protein [Acidimicrobiales bacterium]